MQSLQGAFAGYNMFYSYLLLLCFVLGGLIYRRDVPLSTDIRVSPSGSKTSGSHVCGQWSPRICVETICGEIWCLENL